MRAALFTLLFVISSSLVSVSAEKPPLEEYAKKLTFRAATLSPDGSKIAMLVRTDEQLRMIVYKTSGEPILQAPIEDIKANSLQFYSNNHVILRASETTRVRGFRGEFENSGSISVNLETKQASLLLDRTDDIFPAQSGLGRILCRGHN